MMNKEKLALLLAFTIGFSFYTVPAVAATKENISVYPNAATIYVDGQEVDGQSFLYNNTIYIPLRGVVEKMGGNVEWRDASKRAMISSKASLEALGIDKMQQENLLAYMVMSECMNDLFISGVEIHAIVIGGSTKNNIDIEDSLAYSLQSMNELSLPKEYQWIVEELNNDQLVEMVKAYDIYKEYLNKLGNEAMKYNLQPELLKKCKEPIKEALLYIRADYKTCMARSFNYIGI